MTISFGGFGNLFGGGGVGRQSVEKSNEQAKIISKVFRRPLYKSSRRNKTRQNIVHTRWDAAMWDEVREVDEISEGILDLYTGDKNDKSDPNDPDDPGRVNWENAPEGVQDLFYTLYKTAPRFEKKAHVHKSAQVTRKILEELMNLPDFQSLHDKTVMDPMLSTVATEQMFEPLKEIIKRLEEGDGGGGGEGEDSEGEGEGGCGAISKSNQQRQEEDEEEEGEGKGSGEDGGDEDEDGEESDQGDPPDVLDEDDLLDDEDRDYDDDMELEEESEELQKEWDELDELFEDAGVDRLLNRLVEQVNKELETSESVRKDFGLEDGEWKSMDPRKRYELAEKFRTPNMKKLAERVGKMRRFALGVRHERVIDSQEEIYDVELGNDIRRILRSQFVFLSDPVAKLEFYRRYHDQELLQFKLRGHEKAGKGPVIIAIDKSGSMSGDPFDWAMAVAEALRRISEDEDRDYYAMFFGSNNDRERFDFTKETLDQEAREGKLKIDKVLSFLSCVANGGTQFDGVLNEALERARQDFESNSKTNADIVFVTDGCAALDDDWIDKFNEERERIKAQVFSVYVTGARDAYHMERLVESGPVKLLQRISDHVIPVTDLTEEAVGDIFRGLN